MDKNANLVVRYAMRRAYRAFPDKCLVTGMDMTEIFGRRAESVDEWDEWARLLVAATGWLTRNGYLRGTYRLAGGKFQAQLEITDKGVSFFCEENTPLNILLRGE